MARVIGRDEAIQHCTHCAARFIYGPEDIRRRIANLGPAGKTVCKVPCVVCPACKRDVVVMEEAAKALPF